MLSKSHSTHARVLLLVYFLVLFVSIIIKDIYSYGGYIEVFLVFIAVLYNTRVNNTNNILVILALLLPIYILRRGSIIYFIGDFASALLTLTMIDLSQLICLTKRQQKQINIILLIYFLLFVLFSFSPSFYDGGDDRYMGLLPTATVSSSVIITLLILFIEINKRSRYNLLVFAFAIVIVITNIKLCRTRSVLFVLPYIFYTFYKVTSIKNLRYLSIFATLIIIGYTLFLISNSTEVLRLSSDESSLVTRTTLYEEQFIRIKDNYFIIPYGFNSCTKYIQSITNEDFSPHNSFLQYWYDWGISWLIYFVIVYRKIKKIALQNHRKIQVCLIMLFIASCALHNILLYSYIWIPLMLIFNQIILQKEYEEYEK